MPRAISQVVGFPATGGRPSAPSASPDAQALVHRVRCNPDRGEDERLVQNCLAGDEHAWTELVRSYRGLVFSIAGRFGARHHDAADILQAVCIEVLNSLSQLKNAQSFRSWLITVTVRKSLLWKGKHGNEVPLESVEPEAEEISVAANMPHTVWLEQQKMLLQQGLARLPKRNAEMVRLLFFETPPVPYEEVAHRLGLACGSIGFIRGRVLARLRKILMEAGHDRRAMM
jgi:RNA polymerase sigma factor (sigma-70 family)